jgi:hypothetical protein
MGRRVKTMRVTKSSFEISVENQGFASKGVKSWMAVFPLVSAGLFAAQLSASATFFAAAALTAGVAGLAHASVCDADNDGRFEMKQRMIRLIAPAQFALLIWLAVYAGRAMASTLAGSSVAALFVFAALLALDFMVSMAALLIAERREGVSGLSLASLISGKYAGLLGKIF